jgi:hypothetical protein
MSDYNNTNFTNAEGGKPINIALLVANSLMFALADKKGVVYILDKDKYVSLESRGGLISVESYDGVELKKEDRQTFIENALSDSNCIGLVPLSENIMNELTNQFGLRQIIEGKKIRHLHPGDFGGCGVYHRR